MENGTVTVMNKVKVRIITGHRIYIFSMAFIVLIILVYLLLAGNSFYNVPIEERFFHPDYAKLKPSGTWGHGLGIIGSLAMITGVVTYMARKRMRKLHKVGILKHWLEFHIFLCTLGPIMVMFHTSFKFGGLVAISFWSMVAVFISGIIGRFIYIAIPRTNEGRELSLNEVRSMNAGLPQVDIDKKLNKLRHLHKLFTWWHVAHLPFAIIMLIIMLIHVTVTIIFGYRWIF